MAEENGTRPPIAVEGADGVLSSILGTLLQAFQCARDVEEDCWDFAVGLASLGTPPGVAETMLRWLAARGYVEHRLETTLPSDKSRSFRSSGRFGFADTSRFVLTTSGATFARVVLADQGKLAENGRPAAPHATCPRVNDRPASSSGTRSDGSAGVEGDAQNDTPFWDPLRREFRVGNQVVKRFKLPSANQETLLMAFQEEGWPPRIDDPLPPRPNQDSKMRLHNAIKGLNRHQKCRLVRFMGDGTGEGVLWERAAPED